MKKITSIILSLFLLSFSVSAQIQKEGGISKWLNQKQGSKRMQESRLFDVSSHRYDGTSKVNTSLEEFQILSINTNIANHLAKKSTQDILISLPFLGNEVKLRMSEIKITSNDYIVRSTKGIERTVEAKHYRGIVDGNSNSIAAISIINGEIYGVFGDDSGDYNLGKIEDGTENYILYPSSAMRANLSHECGNDESHSTDSFPNRVDNSNNHRAAGDLCKKVRLYWEADNNLYTNKGTVANTEAYLLAIFNQMAALYQNDGIIVELSETKIWDTSDPYDGSNAGLALDDFKAAWNSVGNSFNGDLAHLVTLDPSGNGGIAYVNTLCYRTNAYGYSRISASYNDIPTYSWTIVVLAHEIGHNLASPHTHSCAWNGNNTKIDNCGGHYSAAIDDTNCPDIPQEPVNGGTIMSYCHLTSTGINLANGFHPQVKTLIHNQITNASCLESSVGLNTVVTDICTPADGSIDLTVSGGTSGYSFDWTPGGATSEDITNVVSATTYTVTVTDSNSCTNSLTTEVDVLSATGDAMPNTAQCLSGSSALSASAPSSAIDKDEIIGWWITGGNPISTTVTDQASLDSNLPASVGGTISGATPNVIYESTSDSSYDIDYDCANLNPGVTYYATPFISGKKAAIPEASCVANGNITPTTINGSPGKRVTITPSNIPCVPTDAQTLPTYTLSIVINGYTGAADNVRLVIRKEGSGGPIIVNTFISGNGTYDYTETNFAGYDPGASGQNGFYMFAWEDNGIGGGAMTITVTLDITYPGVPEITFPTVGYHSCIFGTPIEFTCASACAIPTTIPSDSGTYSPTHECTDASGWTHYWNDPDGASVCENDGDELLLLSIKKNGNDIGTVGDGTFSLTLSGDTNPSQITSSTAPYVLNPNPWWVMNRYWTLNPTNEPVSDVSVRHYFNTIDYDNLENEIPAMPLTDMYFWKINDVSTTYNTDPTAGHPGVPLASAYNADGYWQYKNGPSASTTDWEYTPNALGHASYHQAEFVVGHFGGGGAGGSIGGVGGLPVEMLYFNAEKIKDDVLLKWGTATEENSSHFDVERSTNGTDFSKIGRVKAAGNSLDEQKYSFIDENPSIGVNYYRLLQYDLDASYDTYGLVAVNFAEEGLIDIFPVPVKSGAFNIKYNAIESGKIQLEIFDTNGRLVKEGTENVSSGMNTIPLEHQLSNGVYYIKVMQNGYIGTLKFIVAK